MQKIRNIEGLFIQSVRRSTTFHSQELQKLLCVSNTSKLQLNYYPVTLLAVTLAENLSQLLAQLLSSTLDTVLTLVKLRVQRLFKSSMVTLLVNTMFIPFTSCPALVTLLRYSAIYKNNGLNDNHFLLLVSNKYWHQLSISKSLSNYLPGPKSQCMLMYVGIQGKGLHGGFIHFQDLEFISLCLGSSFADYDVMITLLLILEILPRRDIHSAFYLVTSILLIHDCGKSWNTSGKRYMWCVWFVYIG